MGNEATAPLILWADKRLCSPWVLSVWIVLKEKQLPFTLKLVDLRSNDSAVATYLKSVPTGKIPSLQHEKQWIAESQAIAEYLEEIFPPPQYWSAFSENAGLRAKEREILSWLRTDFFELRKCLPFEGLFEQVSPSILTDSARDEIGQLIRTLETRIQMGIREPKLVDFELAFMVKRLVHYKTDLAPYPSVAQFADSIWQLPSIQSWVRSPDR